MAAWKVAPAIAAGCAVVLKPAEQTPLDRAAAGRAGAGSGLPAGHPQRRDGIRRCGCRTGGASRRRQDRLHRLNRGRQGDRTSVAGNLKKVSLELGGKSPHIVFPDADLDAAAAAVANGIFFNQGQTCTAGSRLYAHASCFDRVVSAVTDIARKLKIGDGLQPDSELGPLVSAGAVGSRQRLRRHRPRGGSQAPHWRQASPRARSRLFLRADGVRECDRRHAHRARGDLRPGADCAALEGCR